MQRPYRSRFLRLVLICLVISPFLSGCATLSGLMQKKIQLPELSFSTAKLSKLSFDAADLLFDIKIKNPNALGVKLAGFDYDLFLAGNSFLKGKQNKALNIPAQGENNLELPLSLNFQKVYDTIKMLMDKDSTNFEFRGGLSFNLPVLGNIRIPIKKAGDLPLPKIPQIYPENIKMKATQTSFGIPSGADFDLIIKVKNPNAFAMILQNLNYNFVVNGKKWVTGSGKQNAEINQKGEGTLRIPISMNFLEMGTAAYDIVVNGREFSYNFAGLLDMATSVPLLGNVKLPFNQNGKLKIYQ
jgi:LEA14-like dessication related protein